MSFWRNGLMSLAAVTSILAALLAFGGALVALWNLQHLTARVETQLVVVAYLRDGLSAAEVKSLRQQAASLAGVQDVVFVPREVALRRLEQALGGVDLDEVLRRNPLPHTLEVRPKRPQDLAQIAKALRSLPGIEEVTYGGDATDRLLALTRLVRGGGAAAAAVLAVVATVVTTNALRLTILARQQEIEIMRLVGATRWFVRGPFLVEGALHGIIAGLCAVALGGGLYAWLVRGVRQAWPFLPVLSLGQVMVPLAVALLTAGVTLGLLGAAVSVGRFVRP